MFVDELVKKLQAEQEYRPTAVAVIYRGEGDSREYLILKTSNSEIDPDDPFPDTWLLLQGGIKPGETYQEGLYREIFEESGIDEKELKLEKIMEPSEVIYKDFSEEKLPISGIYTKGKAYIVSYLEYIGEGNLKLNGENSEAVWVSKDKAIELFRLGEPKKAEELVGYISMEA